MIQGDASTCILTPNTLRPRQPGLVSVIVPSYNAEASLARCIDHVLGQTYSHVELIVVNDGSQDSTEAIALAYGSSVKYIRQENQGETAARNRGFSETRGEFVTFVDHDDYWDPQFIAKTVAFLRHHPETVAVSVAQDHRSALNAKTTIRPAFLATGKLPDTDSFVISNFFTFWAQHDHICAGAAMLRGSLIDEAGGQRVDLPLSGDMEFWAYLATFGKWGFIPQVLLHVDGTQAAKGNLYAKFHQRYAQCPSVAAWQSRVIPRLKPEDHAGFARVRGRVAAGYTFAHVFVGRDQAAYRTARQYRHHLDGPFAGLWRVAVSAGWLSWFPTCLILRARTRLQYSRRNTQR